MVELWLAEILGVVACVAAIILLSLFAQWKNRRNQARVVFF
jgi:hypothetical protein